MKNRIQGIKARDIATYLNSASNRFEDLYMNFDNDNTEIYADLMEEIDDVLEDIEIKKTFIKIDEENTIKEIQNIIKKIAKLKAESKKESTELDNIETELQYVKDLVNGGDVNSKDKMKAIDLTVKL